MPRSKPRKSTRRPAKPVPHRRDSTSSALSPDLNDDEGYSGVDDVSDADEDDEARVLAAEQEHLTRKIRIKVPQKWAISSARPQPNPRQQEMAREHEVSDKHADETNSNGRSDQADDEDGDDEGGGNDDGDDDEDDDDEDKDEGNDDGDDQNINHLGEHAYDDDDDDDGYSTLDEVKDNWTGIVTEEDEVATVQCKQVRFVEVPSSDSDTTYTDYADFYPDLFVPQASLDPSFKREIELDGAESSTSGSYWDYSDSAGNTTGLFAGPDGSAAVTSPVIFTSLQALSRRPPEPEGYESDGEMSDGFTTDEEAEPGSILPLTSPVDPLPSPVDLSTDGDHNDGPHNGGPHNDGPRNEGPHTPTRAQSAPAVRVERGKPRVGSFDLQSSGNKSVLVANRKSRTIMIFTQAYPPRAGNLLGENDWKLDDPFSGWMDMAPHDTTSFRLLCHNPAIGQPFFPSSSESSLFDDEGVGEGGLNVDASDFLKSGSDEEVGDELDPGCYTSPGTSTSLMPAACLTSATHMASPNDGLMSHFDKGSDTVGAFRRNQINERLISSQKATQDSLDLSGGLHDTTLRGIRKDSMATVSTPITPVRRRKSRKSQATDTSMSVGANSMTSGSIAEPPSLNTGFYWDHDDLTVSPLLLGPVLSEMEPSANPNSKKRALGDEEEGNTGAHKKVRLGENARTSN